MSKYEQKWREFECDAVHSTEISTENNRYEHRSHMKFAHFGNRLRFFSLQIVTYFT